MPIGSSLTATQLRAGSLWYTEAVELADVLGYDLVWQKRREVR